MILVNLTKGNLNYYFDGVIVDVAPESESSDILLTEDNIRSVIFTAKPDQVKFKVTARGVDDVALSKLGVDPSYIWSEESKESKKQPKTK